MSDQQIAALRDGSYAAGPLFDEREKAVACLAEKVTKNVHSVTDEDVQDLKQWFSDAEVVELVFAISMMNMSNRFNICLATDVDAWIIREATGKSA